MGDRDKDSTPFPKIDAVGADSAAKKRRAIEEVLLKKARDRDKESTPPSKIDVVGADSAAKKRRAIEEVLLKKARDRDKELVPSPKIDVVGADSAAKRRRAIDAEVFQQELVPSPNMDVVGVDSAAKRGRAIDAEVFQQETRDRDKAPSLLTTSPGKEVFLFSKNMPSLDPPKCVSCLQHRWPGQTSKKKRWHCGFCKRPDYGSPRCRLCCVLTWDGWNDGVPFLCFVCWIKCKAKGNNDWNLWFEARRCRYPEAFGLGGSSAPPKR